jgi:hypothetical protein
MEHALLSASAAARWLNCTAAPRYEAQFPESTSAYADEGRLAHSFCELKVIKYFTTAIKPSTFKSRLAKLKKDEQEFIDNWNKAHPDKQLSAEGDRCSDLFLEHIKEKAMGYNSPPLVNAEVKVDFGEYVPDGFGTCDNIMIGGDLLDITDYKHGKGVPVSAEKNPQMRLYALGALKHYAPFYGGMIKRIRTTIFQPRAMYEDDRITSETLTVEELLAWGESIKPIAQMAFSGFGEFKPDPSGDGWCRFCRGKAQCRARADAHTALEDFKDFALPTPENQMEINKGGLAGMNMPPILTNAEIGDLLIRGASLVAWYNDLEEYALAAMLRGEDIAGWKVVAGRSNRTFTDHDKAIAAVIAAGYDEALVYERKPKTLTALETLMGKKDFAEKIGEFVYKPPGKPTPARLSDKREPYSTATADFAEVAKTEVSG